MSVVVERIQARSPEILSRISDELGHASLPALMRKATWRDHRRAETSAFEVALVKGTIDREAYADLLVQLLPAYEALEARETELADDPRVAPLLEPRLHRSSAIRADIAYFLGDDHEPTATMPVAIEYATRIASVPAERYAAHHYCRYLADLSGGFDIHAGLTRALGDPRAGLSYYDFTELGDANEFKVAYRGSLATLPLSAEEQAAVIEEVAIAFEFNIELVAELAVKHGIDAAGEAPAH